MESATFLPVDGLGEVELAHAHVHNGLVHALEHMLEVRAHAHSKASSGFWVLSQDLVQIDYKKKVSQKIY